MKRIISILTFIAILSLTVSCVSADNESIFPSHEPYGKGVGATPGKVVWSHEPDSVDWDGNGYWWEISNFNESVILDMVNSSVAKLGNTSTAKEGWNVLFKDRNERNGERGGYKSGEKIAIKANINGSAVFDDDTSGETKMSYTNPVLLKALLTSLVEEAGVAPSDITVYDVSRLFSDYMVEMCNEGILQGVNFVTRDNGVADENAPIEWSYAFSGNVNYLPTCVTEAKYMINLANLKGHSYGITLCGKNHFGSFINGNAMFPPEGANLHQWLTRNEMGIYSPLVDLMANKHLGGKTVLYMLDAIICATSEGSSITGNNSRWQQAPFNDDYTSSIFVSQDPVAIDSVGADFLTNEPTIINNNSSARNAAVENYLHEAGLVANAPSGTVYTDSFGETITNLGVHEHWNNSTDKQYSRNLGKDEGIELVMADETAKPVLTTEDNKIIVNNAVPSGTLILAFYDNGVLVGVNTHNGSGTITADIGAAPEGADKVKAFYWDMKNITPLGNMIALPLNGGATETPSTPEPTNAPTQKRALTVYFSCTGNTKYLAEKVAKTAGTDLYEIVPEIPYTSDDLNYNNNSSRANQEQNDPDARPAISGNVENISDYDTIILGYPIWWGTIPRIINTFLESYDLSGKTIMPFCTSGSTSISGSVSAIRSAYPDITVTEGLRGTNSTTTAQIEKWLTDNGFEINAEESDTMKMRVASGDIEVIFELNNTSAAKSLYDQLPLTIDVENYGGNEKIFYPEKLDCSDVIEGDCPTGTLAYFSPWGDVVMYYAPAFRYSGLYILGEAVEGVDNISRLSGTIEITKAN